MCYIYIFQSIAYDCVMKTYYKFWLPLLFCYSGSTTGSTPIFFYSNIIIKRFNYQSILIYSQLITVARLLVLALVTAVYKYHNQSSYPLVIFAFIQLAHGVSFALYWSCVVDIITVISRLTFVEMLKSFFFFVWFLTYHCLYIL